MSHQTELDKAQTALLFEEESLAVHPYLHTLPRKEFAGPDMRLVLVVLEDALRCLEKYVLARDGQGKALFDETEDCVFAKNDDWIFSFSNVCEVLGYNRQCIRNAVLQWKRKKLEIEPATATP
jgi:hypothetical protein